MSNGQLPAGSITHVRAGKSAATSARKVGTLAAPVVGPAHTVLAVSVAFVNVNVPVVVTGEPLTINSTGEASATLVTLPLPLPHGEPESTALPLASHRRQSFVVFVPVLVANSVVFPD